MIFLLTLYSLFLHASDAVLARPLDLLPLHSTFETSFHPREIDPNKLTNRSEWNIVWSCFATIFACSWIAIHPNIPAPSDSSMRIFVRRLMIMGCMLIVPEMVIVWATRQWYAAHDIAEKHKGREWTITHGFFVSMGGFMLYEDGVMTRTLEMQDLELLVSQKKIDWPSISEKDIQDKSKADSFSKAFVVLQTTWFFSQCFARGVAGLTITELELVTFAFAVLNGILYFLWWNKPLGVFRPVPVHLRHPTTSDTSERPDSSTSFQHSSTFARFRAYFGKQFMDKGLFAPIYIFIQRPFQIIASPAISMLFDDGYLSDSRPGQAMSVPTFYAPRTVGDDRARLIGIGIGVLFGGIHCSAWAFKFQSIAEQYSWRISAVSVTVLPIIITVVFTRRMLIRYTVFPCMMIYWVSRAALLILPLIALRSLPAASLVDFKWTAFIPHI